MGREEQPRSHLAAIRFKRHIDKSPGRVQNPFGCVDNDRDDNSVSRECVFAELTVGTRTRRQSQKSKQLLHTCASIAV